MVDNEKRGMEYMEEARRKLNSSRGIFSSFFGGGTRHDEAIELYCKAANSFKMSKSWSLAGQAFSEAAAMHLKQGNRLDASNCYIDAGVSYKKTDAQEAINAYLKAIEIFTDMGRFSVAAKQHVTLAEIYEQDVVDLEKAMLHYEQAADYFKGEESIQSANRCLLQVAKHAAQLQQYQKAIEIYEQVGSSCIDNSLLKYSAKDYFFRAALCHMCVDSLNAKMAMDRYDEMFPTFADSRESKFVRKLLDTVETGDADAYTAAVQEYDSISRFDPWYTRILLNIKQSLNQEDLR